MHDRMCLVITSDYNCTGGGADAKGAPPALPLLLIYGACV